MTIQMLTENSYFVSARGSKMTLTKINEYCGIWQMETDNASHRAYRGLGVRYFDNLQQVEKAYKSWKGISLLV
jgi:hypothetical protein